MKFTTPLFLMVFFAGIVLVGCSGNQEATEADLATIDSLNAVLNSRNQELNNQIELLNNIDAALKDANSDGNLQINDPEKVKSIDKEIFSKIALLKNKLESDSRKVEKLQADLNKAKDSSSYRKDLLSKMNSKMEKLKQENELLKQKVSSETMEINALIAELRAQGVKIKSLNAELTKLNSNIVELKNEINTVYYLIGTQKELKHDSIIVKTGIGGAITLSEYLNKADFANMDKTQMNSIALTGFKKAHVVPQRPENSYKWIKNEEGKIVRLEITRTADFWNVSKYLVIVVK